MRLGALRDLIGDLTFPLVKGSSKTLIENGRMIKFETPTPFVRLLHFAASGRLRHPYESQEYLELAYYRRRIANLVLEFFLGQENLVAPIEEILYDGTYGYGVSAPFIEGEIPARSSAEMGQFLAKVCEAFTEAGLSTWQVNARLNPRSHTNVIQTKGSRAFVIIDLESQIVTPTVPGWEWRTAWRQGRLVPFDVIDFERLFKFVDRVKRENWPKADCLRREVREAYDSFLSLTGSSLKTPALT